MHLLTESEASCDRYLEQHPVPEDAHWYTTSPWLLEKLPMRGFRVTSLEKEVTPGHISKINRLTVDIAKGVCGVLDDEIKSEHLEMGRVFRGKYRRSVFSVLYKWFLLNRWMDGVEERGGQGRILGDPAIHANGLGVDRFDTLYAILADRLDLPRHILLERQAADPGRRQKQKIQGLGGSLAERSLLLLNSNLPLLVYKLWKRLLGGTDISIRSSKNDFNIFFYLECELLEESLLYFLLQGCRVIDFKKVMKQLDRVDSNDQWKADHNKLTSIWEKEIQYHGYEVLLRKNDVSNVAHMIHEMLEFDVNKCLDMVPSFQSLAEKLRCVEDSDSASRNALVGNALASPPQKAMSQIFAKAGVPVFAFEHGVTNGICLAMEDWLEENAMTNSHAWVCFNEVSNDYHRRSKPDGAGISAGMPLVHRKVRLPSLQKRLVRRSLNLPMNARVVIYVASLYHNNQIYGPSCFTDHAYHDFKKRVVFEALGSLGDPCLVKLYPTYRYLDDDPFAALLPLPRNVRTVQFVEYRYLRAVADVVLCDSPQSTLGWVWSTGKPFIFLDHPFSPMVPSAARALDGSVFRISCDTEDWLEDLRSLLQLPHSELQRRWKEKEAARSNVEEAFIFGPAGKAGKRSADFILQEVAACQRRASSAEARPRKWGRRKPAGRGGLFDS